ncbi:MAG: HAD-IA family hydrolase [Solirubrobacteraceae bacterium MAG38_C4-C5]|nr:HAD-IA family hydrolase [Candidatus Siliceabacter maunaloa]
MAPGEGQGLQAVVLDVDGTLVDSERDGHRVAFNRAFEEAGLEDRWDVELYGELLAVTGGDRRLNAYFEQRGMAEDERRELAGRLHARKTEIFTAMAREGEITPRPGVGELLDELEAADVRLSVATTGSRAWVRPLLDRLFGLERFETIVTSEEAPERKPDPSAHRMALENLGLPASAAPAVEDSLNGLQAAMAAGLACVVVVNDYTREQGFDGADLVLDGFGRPDDPVAVLADPHHLDPPGRLDVETLRRLVIRGGSSG